MDKNIFDLSIEKIYSLPEVFTILIAVEKNTPFFIEDGEDDSSRIFTVYSYDHISNQFIKTSAYKVKNEDRGCYIYDLYNWTRPWNITKYDFKKNFKLKFGAGTNYNIKYTLSDNPNYAVHSQVK